MQIDPLKISDLYMQSNFILEAYKEFGGKGEKCIGIVVDCVRNVFRTVPPEQVSSQILIKKCISDSDSLVEERGNPLGLERLTSDLIDRFKRQENVLITIMPDGLFSVNGSSEMFRPENHSIDSIVYYYFNTQEGFFVGESYISIKKPNAYLVSIFAQPTYSSVETALDRYSDEVAPDCTCKILEDVWLEGKDGKRLIFSNKPESIMRNSLDQYLSTVLEEARVKAEQATDDSKPVDLRVDWYGSRAVVLIEVKWIGKSVSKSKSEKQSYTSHNDSRVLKGADQVIDYVKREKSTLGEKTVKGYLVTFDGRRANLKSEKDELSPEDAWYYLDKDISLPNEIENNDDFGGHKRVFLNPRVSRTVGDK